MTTPVITDHLLIDGKPAVTICHEGKLYKFARNEQGQVRCFWWEGRFDLNAIRYLNPFATRALTSPSQPSGKSEGEEHPRNPRHWTERDDD